MKLNILKHLYIVTLILVGIAVSCVDDFPYRNVDIPEGEGVLSATVTFSPVTASNLGATRTDGDAIQNIESLCVLVYEPASEEDGKGKLVKKYSKTDLKNYESSDYKKNEADPSVEGTSAHATFELQDLPYGEYYIFAVANMGDLSEYSDKIETIDGLQHIKLTWKPDEIEKNNQMFGYFTPGDDAESAGFMPEKTITFTGRADDSKIHAWLKRAASKVTVAFDPSGLNQGVTIYVRSVTIRDIPKTCLLGAENTPLSKEDLLNHLDSYENPDYTKQDEVEKHSRLEYDSKGVIEEEGKHTGESKTDGLRLDNSIRTAIPEGAHDFDAPSLFFYENDQNPYLLEQDRDYKGKRKYNKQPQTEKGDDEAEDDRVGQIIHDAEDNKDFKDRVPYGTYIEVEAYYTSSNPANPGDGTIKYRFMLGKDTFFDYDAQRNYHYKLTLGFNGWANDPDWHIDYVITTPGIEVPDVFRVSYLYHQKSELPIKIVGDIRWLTCTITENNWAPYDPNPETNQTITQGGKEYKVPKSVIESDPATYQFRWNARAFDYEAYKNPVPDPNEKDDYIRNLPVGQQRPQFGFLALHLPDRELTTISGVSKNGYGPGDNDALIKYWKEHQEGIRRFGSNSNKGGNDFDIGDHTISHNDLGENPDDNGYTVDPVLSDNGQPIPNQIILQLPVWTRTKSLIGIAGFSGNNPYEAFERKAVLHIAGVFYIGKDAQGKDITERIEKDVTIFQVKRITNPKGVWRAHDKTETFNVTLLEAENSNAESDFKPFTSQGEWTAFIDDDTNDGHFSIRPNGETNGYMENGVIHGNTGSEIHFAINFGAAVKENESQCAVVKVLYHGNQCLHKILVRKGYNAPLRMGGTTPDNGKLWSSFSLYQASSTGRTENGRTVYNAVLTKNPLMLGSMFRRGKQDQGIFVWNNMQTDLAPLLPPYGASYIVGESNNSSITDPKTEAQFKSKWKSMTWDAIGYDNDRADAGRNRNLGIYYDATNPDFKYRVPTYGEFKALTDNSEFGFGVFYGSSATAPKLTSKEAYGLIDPYNEGLFDDPNGMRAVVAYDKKSGNQILFPLGRYGMGTRRMFNVPKLPGTNNGNPDYFGVLHYSDVYSPLSTDADLYRPIPYNMPIISGCVYWIDQYYATTNGCLGWDMNYFNFDFNAYTANNWQDACPIKFVIDE